MNGFFNLLRHSYSLINFLLNSLTVLIYIKDCKIKKENVYHPILRFCLLIYSRTENITAVLYILVTNLNCLWPILHLCIFWMAISIFVLHDVKKTYVCIFTLMMTFSDVQRLLFRRGNNKYDTIRILNIVYRVLPIRKSGCTKIKIRQRWELERTRILTALSFQFCRTFDSPNCRSSAHYWFSETSNSRTHRYNRFAITPVVIAESADWPVTLGFF